MDLANFQISTQRKLYPTFVFFGPPKSGKSSTALTFPKPFVFDMEHGTGELAYLPPDVGRKDAAREFIVVETGSDIGEFIARFNELEKQGLFSKKEPGVETIGLDSSTRIYEAIKDEYQDEKHYYSNDPSLFDKKIELREFGLVKAPLRRIMRTLIHAPYIKVHVMHEASIFTKNPVTGVLEPDGVTFKGEGSILYDASVIVRTFVDNNKFKGEVLIDRTHTYKAGTIINEPGWGHWKKFYEQGGVEDPRSSTILPHGAVVNMQQRVDELMNDKEIVSLFKQAGVPENGWRIACEKYNADRKMIIGRLKERVNGLSDQPK